jgi:hypothetical protein
VIGGGIILITVFAHMQYDYLARRKPEEALQT